MSYPMDLDEHKTVDLLAEVTERVKRHAAGKCSYCKRDHDVQPACKFPRRHSGADV